MEGPLIAPPPTWRLHALTVVLAALAVALGLAAPPASADASTARIAGDDRFATAAELGTRAFDSAEYALIARGGAFPDALAAAPLAGVLSAPILLSYQHEVPSVTLDALERLGVRGAILLGGPDAIHERVEQQLRDEGYDVDRIAGHDRYRTAIDVAQRVGRSTTVWLTNGRTFPDALAAGAPAAAAGEPMLLTPPDRLPDDVEAAIDDLGAERVLIVGGPDAVSREVQRDIEEGGIAVERLGGRDRTDTAVQVALYADEGAGLGYTSLLVSRGDAFPDALAAAPYAAAADAPILLTRDPDTLSYDLLQFTVDNAERIERIVGLGGPQALTDRALGRLAESAKRPVTTYRYAIAVADDHGEVDADVAYFAEHVDWTLVDQRGWALDNDYRFTQVSRDRPHDLTIHLASPQDVDAAAPGCSSRWSCTVGSDVYINVERWNNGTATYADRPLDDYRHYVVIHEVGHWIGLGHYSCSDSPSSAAPVMQQQSIDLEGCSSNVWPLQFERDEARDHLAGGSQGQTTTEE